VTGVHLVLCTAPPGRAGAIAEALLAEGLCACVNEVQVRSRYRWQGRLEDAPEALLLIKTRSDLLDALRRRIAELHPYQVPEVLEFAAGGGLEAYLQWVAGSVRAERPAS
jgi:periplasmic divalent cation tolerance protein